MRITFLGTGAGVPSRIRNVSALALRLPESAETWMFDCGEGTQHRVIESVVSFSQITRVFISHMHGDHVLGLPGLLASAGLAGDPRRVDIYGPRGLASVLTTVLEGTQTTPRFPWAIHEIEPGLVVEASGFRVRCALLEHSVPTFGFRVEENDRPGRFEVARARALGVTDGPSFGRLKSGESVELPDGTVVLPDGLSAPPEPGRVFTYCTDTSYTTAAIDLARGADLLVHESTFGAAEAELARRSGHATSEDAAHVAREAGVGRLFLTHISSRYAAGNSPSADDLLAEARAIFPPTELAEDLLSVHVPRRAATSQ